MIKKWEYRVELLVEKPSDDLDERLLNSLGEEGWELVAVVDTGREAEEDMYKAFKEGIRAYFKREKKEEEKEE